MDRNQCNDRAGKNHFGEYGWLDGYQGSISNCRVELKMRGSCCADLIGLVDSAAANIY